MEIISECPTRISLFGGGTDVEPYASQYGGLCVSMAINLRQQIRLTDQRVGWSIPDRANKRFYQAIFDYYELDRRIGLEAKFDGIIESGLGSSAALTVALVGTINKLKDRQMSLYQTAQTAWEIEVNQIGLYGGKQDQFAASYGGANIWQFGGDRVRMQPLKRGVLEPLLPSMVLLYSGKNRTKTDIQDGLKQPSTQQISTLHEIKKLAQRSIKPIKSADFEYLGCLLKDSWQLKKQSNQNVNTPYIDALFDKADQFGAYGGKLLGSGGGGFMLFIVHPLKRQRFIADMGLQHWDFGVCYQGLNVRRVPEWNA